MGLVGNIVNNSGVLQSKTPLMLDRVRNASNNSGLQTTNTRGNIFFVPKTMTVPVAPALRNVASNAVRNSLFGKGSFESSNANLSSIQANVARANGATAGTTLYKVNLGNAQRYLDAAAKSTGQARTNNMNMARKELQTAHNIMAPKRI